MSVRLTAALMLAALRRLPFRVTVAWVIAQGTATAVNFAMLRWVVFRPVRGG